MAKLLIVDYSTTEVHVFPYNGADIEDEVESFISTICTEHGQSFKIAECTWMLINEEDRLPLYIH